MLGECGVEVSAGAVGGAPLVEVCEMVIFVGVGGGGEGGCRGGAVCDCDVWGCGGWAMRVDVVGAEIFRGGGLVADAAAGDG